MANLSLKERGNLQKQINEVKKAASNKGTAAELQAGTSTEVKQWDAKTINDEIARQIAAITP